MPGIIALASAVAEIINKKMPGRREGAVRELHKLEELLGRALKENEDLLAAQIRKRTKQIRGIYGEID